MINQESSWYICIVTGRQPGVVLMDINPTWILGQHFIAHFQKQIMLFAKYWSNRNHTSCCNCIWSGKFLLVSWGGARQFTWYVGLLYQPRMVDYTCGAVGMMNRVNRSTRRKPAAVRICPQISHDLTLSRTQAARMDTQRLTAWASAQEGIVMWNETFVRRF
jgi:hypothetical protein